MGKHMTQPFWRWTGWLSLGLAGCLHGDVRQSQVRVGPSARPGSQSVVPVSEQRAHARLLSATMAANPQSATTAGETSAAEPATSDPGATFRVAIPGPTMGSARSTSNDCPTCSREECALPRTTDSTPSEFVPEAIPAAELPATDTVQTPPPMTITPYRPPVAWVAEEPRPFTPKTPVRPLSQAAPARTSGKPSLDDDFFPDDHESSATAPVRQASNQKPLDSPPHDQPVETTEPQRTKMQESPDVAEQLANTLPEESVAQPRDVALLVDQVFEDLRQRRLADARQRTEWLKQLVARRSTPSEVSEPRMLNDLEAATPIEPIEPAEVEDFFDEQTPKSEYEPLTK